MASCARKGLVVLTIAVGSAARAIAEARVVMQAGGVREVPGLLGLMNEHLEVKKIRYYLYF